MPFLKRAQSALCTPKFPEFRLRRSPGSRTGSQSTKTLATWLPTNPTTARPLWRLMTRSSMIRPTGRSGLRTVQVRTVDNLAKPLRERDWVKLFDNFTGSSLFRQRSLYWLSPEIVLSYHLIATIKLVDNFMRHGIWFLFILELSVVQINNYYLVCYTHLRENFWTEASLNHSC